MGFYDQFTPLVQGYSCAESPLWLGKAFLCLELPPEHPFWTAKENNGTWERLEKGGIKETTLAGPALCYTNHEANGETILRSAKVFKEAGDIHGMWNYGKLNYNTKYPWESTPHPQKDSALEQEEEAGAGRTVCEAQQYLLFEQESGEPSRGNITLWCGQREGVLYRRQFFNAALAVEQYWIQAVNLADFPVERGIMRVDKLRLIRRPVTMTLGSYGFPDNPGADGSRTRILKKEERLPDGSLAQAVILIGRDHMGVPRQMADLLPGLGEDGGGSQQRHQSGFPGLHCDLCVHEEPQAVWECGALPLNFPGDHSAAAGTRARTGRSGMCVYG